MLARATKDNFPLVELVFTLFTKINRILICWEIFCITCELLYFLNPVLYKLAKLTSSLKPRRDITSCFSKDASHLGCSIPGSCCTSLTNVFHLLLQSSQTGLSQPFFLFPSILENLSGDNSDWPYDSLWFINL